MVLDVDDERSAGHSWEFAGEPIRRPGWSGSVGVGDREEMDQIRSLVCAN